MAGIGFELNKMFKEKGLSGRVRGLGYSIAVIAGPLLLGMAFILVLSALARAAGLRIFDRRLLVVSITYVIIASLFASGMISLPLTRYVADQLYLERDEKVLPSLYGCLSIVLPAACLCYFIFLSLSHLPMTLILINLPILAEMTSIFIVTNYLTAVRNYRGILLSYVLSIAGAFLGAVVLVALCGPSIYCFLLAVLIGYGIQLLTGLLLLADYFPRGKGGYYEFLPWIRRYWRLPLIGTLNNIALFSHMFFMWNSDIGMRIRGFYYSAPQYDIPSLYAYLATLVTTIYFVTSAETNFYGKYARYYSSLNFGETIDEVREAREEMLITLWNDVLHCAIIQLLFTFGMISIGLTLFERMQPGFTMQMKNYYILLSISYGIYATGNMMTLYSMYFTDYNSVLIDSAVFAFSSTLLTWISVRYHWVSYYGAGFMSGCFLFLVVSYIRLRKYTRDLNYEVLSLKPFI